jgi:2-polyprenyl-6-methoxyphenol hydroxylase-like FAD-dependent oxidoreductase
LETPVAIVGKGIAGLTLSLLLHRKGIDHVVLDRVGGRKEIALGETLPPATLPLLRSLGLLAIFEECSLQQTYGYHSSWGSDAVTDYNFFGQWESPYGLKLDKQALLQRLEQACGGAGIAYDKRLALHAHGDGWEIVTDAATRITSGLLVDATGRNRIVLQQLGVPIHGYDALSAFSCHIPRIQHPRFVHSVVVESFEHGWGIVSGLDADRNVLSIYTQTGHPVQPQLRSYHNWAAVLAETKYLKDFLTEKPLSKVVGNNANSSQPAQVAGANWLAVGDAAMAFDPLSSHGISNAIFSAQRAAEAIEAFLQGGDQRVLTGYSQTMTQIFEQYIISQRQQYWSERRWPEAPFWRD